MTKPKLPVTEELRKWTDDGFLRLAKLVGGKRLFESTVVTPTPAHFPDRYDRSEEALKLCQRWRGDHGDAFVPILYVTADASPGARLACLQCGGP